ncbi:inovirus Gp2 family protein [Klebsiella michiganensis]|uniref:inovirus Gp2 family protein n=1 Tax=Klebsiella michiganensis TaxID=1134687 RepID=UPI003CFC69D4
MNIKRHKHYGLLNSVYAKRITSTVDNALNQYPRTLAIRIDLRFPDEEERTDCPTQCYTGPDVISRFINSVKAQIRADIYRKRKAGKKSLTCNVRFVWVREFNQEGSKKHYHVLLLLNKDAYAWPGRIEQHQDNTFNHSVFYMVTQAWIRAIKREYADSKHVGLIHIPPGGFYQLNRNSRYFEDNYEVATARAMYLAKERSKDTSDGYRSFGCSRN